VILTASPTFSLGFVVCTSFPYILSHNLPAFFAFTEEGLTPIDRFTLLLIAYKNLGRGVTQSTVFFSLKYL
jgi:hypothetical protein